MFVTLSPEQQRVAQAVARDGVYQTSVSALGGDSCYHSLRDLALSFADSQYVRDCHAGFVRGERREGLKQFLVKYQDQQRFDERHPLFRFGLLPVIHETACACLQRMLAYYSADLWCVLPDAESKQREWSQNWHRDPEAERLVKVFLFLEDVTEDSGPFEYVSGSHNGGYAEAAEPKRYANQAYVQHCIPPEAKRRFTAPAGTIVFADTSGLHRGGYTKARRRLNCVFTYLPEGKPKFTLESIPLDLSEIQRQALCLN